MTSAATAWLQGLAGLLVASLVGCAATTTTSTVSYRLPILGNQLTGPTRADVCARRCEVTNEFDQSALVQCIAECPGVQIRYGRACTAEPTDAPPVARCYTLVTRREVPPSESDATAFDVLGAIIGTVLDAAIGSGDDEEDSETAATERTETASLEPRMAGTPATTEPARSHLARRPAKPTQRRKRTPARPRRR